MKITKAYVFLGLLFLSMTSAANTLTVNNGNSIEEVNVGDRFMRIMKMNGDINIKVDSNKTADLAVAKLAELINKKKFSMSNILENTEISFRKDLNSMFIHKKESEKLIRMNCYTGEVSHIGNVIHRYKNTKTISNPTNSYGNYSSEPISNGYNYNYYETISNPTNSYGNYSSESIGNGYYNYYSSEPIGNGYYNYY